MEQTLPEPSDRVKTALDEEKTKPEYQGMDPEDAALKALEVVYKTHGDGIFDFANPTDDILRQILTRDGLALDPDPEKKETIELSLTPREIAALDELCTAKDMSRQGTMLAALRLYQAVAMGAATVSFESKGAGCMGD